MNRHEAQPIANLSQTLPRRPPSLGEEERELLAKRRFSEAERARLAHLLEPFEQSLKENVLDEKASSSPRYVEWSCQVARHFLARIMVDLGCTYWGFDWDRLLVWREGVLAQEAGRPKYWHQSWAKHWRWVTQSLFFLGAIPYHEAMCPCSNRRLAQRWLGREKALDLEEAFLATAKRIGYWDERNLKKTVIGALFGALLFAGKQSPAELTKQELEAWQLRTDRSPEVARGSVTCIQKVLAAMGSLAEEPPRRSGKHKRHFSTGVGPLRRS